MSEIHVVATIPIKPEAVEEARSALESLIVATRQEPGVVSYDLYESASAPSTFVMVERYRDQAALDEHMASPHLAAAFAAAEPLLAGEVAIHPLQPVDVG
ncbi:antibiotic biosynthesis monooxygenase [Nocardioides panacisoli]|uniref:putative quinol monooxygenase n=1 Tax=Nocardioides panacisoli TaxID=627624 RepID=UPI001C6368DE|nr:putative quinol monooxygenase [Nocardioides panacisoli]QYJ03714.1 antibiotic biosynthesis monooxygenase [Nocardioides panacisoli]